MSKEEGVLRSLLKVQRSRALLPSRSDRGSKELVLAFPGKGLFF